MIERLKKYVIEIETKGPVHIGNGEKHSPYEFVYQPESKRLGMLNEGKWIKFLKDNKLYEKYENDTLCENFKVYNWMCQNTIEPWSKDIYRYIIDGVEQDKDKGLNDVSCLIKNYKGEPYIPGSSIKGMLRTAILSNHIAKNKNLFSEDWNSIGRYVKENSFKNIEYHIQDIENKCVCVLPQKDTKNKVQKQLLDVFRAILVSDTNSVPVEKITVVQKNDWGEKSIKSGKTIPLWREAIKKDTYLRFSITMDLNMLMSTPIGISKIDDVLEMLNYFYENVLLKFESNFDFKCLDTQYSSKEKPLVYLGGGTGFHTKSVLYSLAPDLQSASKVIAEYLDIVFKKMHTHVITDTKVSPRTIKLAKTENELLKMGLCSMKVVDEVASVD